jgi:hypothetical protein
MLFVPWVYQRLESARTPSATISAKARRLELDLVGPLLEADDRSGVFGRSAGKDLKRLPSDVYWAGLGEWGIRLFPGSREQYHRALDAIYRKRDDQMREAEQETSGVGRSTRTWHPQLPGPPADFPKHVSLRVTQGEAQFLLDRIATTQKGSLLAHLALHCKPCDVDFPWEHPERAGFVREHLELLERGRLFSEVMYGATLMYNIALAQLAGRTELGAEHVRAYSEWAEGLDGVRLQAWDFSRLWELTVGHAHDVTPATRRFVEDWVLAVRRGAGALVEDRQAQSLIQRRESELKGPRSRYAGGRALDQWSGYAGLVRMDYRWARAHTLLKDLYDGLARKG